MAIWQPEPLPPLFYRARILVAAFAVSSTPPTPPSPPSDIFLRPGSTSPSDILLGSSTTSSAIPPFGYPIEAVLAWQPGLSPAYQPRILVAAITATAPAQPPKTSLPASIYLAWNTTWPTQTAPPSAGWNVPLATSTPKAAPQPHITQAWNPPPYTLPYVTPSVVSTLPRGDTPPAAVQLQVQILSAWQPAWLEPQWPTEVAPVIPLIAAPQTYAAYPITSILAWTSDPSRPPVPVAIAPLTQANGDQPPRTGSLDGAADQGNLATVLQSWVSPWMEPQWPVEIAPVLPSIVLPILAPLPQPHIIGAWPAAWWAAQSAPLSIPVTQSASPPPTQPISPQNSGILEQAWVAPWLEPPFLVEGAPLTPAIVPPVLAPLPQPHVVAQWPAIWWPVQSAPKSTPLTQAAPPPLVPPISSANLSVVGQAWVPPWIEPPFLVEIAPLTPAIVLPVLAPIPQPHIIGSWPPIWWADQSEPFSVPISQGSQPSSVPPLSTQNLSTITAQWPAIWWAPQTAPPNAGWNVPPTTPPHVPYPIGIVFSTLPPWYGPPAPVVIAPLTLKYGSQPPVLPSLSTGVLEAVQLAQPAWYGPPSLVKVASLLFFTPPPVISPLSQAAASAILTWQPAWYGPPKPVKIVPLTLTYGQQPPKNGPMVGAEDIENLLAINQWPAIWWPSQRAPFGAAELFIPPALPISFTNYKLIVSLWPQPEALPKGTTLTPAWSLGLPFVPAYNRRARDGEIKNFTAGERFDILRSIPGIQLGRRIVQAWLTVKTDIDDPDSEAILRKVITGFPVETIGWIIDDGSTTGLGTLVFQITEADSTAIGFSRVLFYDIQIEFDNGEIVTKEKGTVTLRRRLTTTNS